MIARADTALLADIGGTYARFALCQNGVLGPITRLMVADYLGVAEAIETFLTQTDIRAEPHSAVLAVAGPVTGDSARLTNGAWEFSGETLRVAFDFERLDLVNDFVAVALALPHLEDHDLEKLGGRQGIAKAPLAVIGPGTGLGVAALLSSDETPVVLASEGGHVTLPAHDEQECALLGRLRGELGHVAAEDILSGPGLATLYKEIAAYKGLSAPPRDPAEIVGAALAGDCPASGAALELFCALLGSFAGDLALTFGARGGVYLAGGIVPRLVNYLKKSRFRTRFEGKGSFRDYLTDIPCYVVTRPDPAFLGLAGLISNRADSRS